MRRREGLGPENGYYLEVESRPNQVLLTDKLERGRKYKTRLLSVRREGNVTKAAVFVPVQAKELFNNVIRSYEEKEEPLAAQSVPKGWKLVEGIGRFRFAGLRDLWTGNPNHFPEQNALFPWEVWLRPGTEERFRMAANQIPISLSGTMLMFPEELALHALATPEQMERLVNNSVSVTRLERAAVTAGFFEILTQAEQAALADQIAARVRINPNPVNFVCILDTGVTRMHPLLNEILLQEDCHAYRQEWGTDDHDDHGTLMSGLSAFGDLIDQLNSAETIEVPHRLESSKIYPRSGENPHELLGAITQGGVARVEFANPHRIRVFCLASSTADDSPHRGRPSSWAAEIDQLCVGLNQEQPLPRLMCVSAGNVRRNPYARADYLNVNDLEEVESPGQSWNALTVGAYTEKTAVVGPGRDGWIALAPTGDLCPTSRTSVQWESQWPSKPDIVLEGGNLGVDPADNNGYGIDSLKLLSTSRHAPRPYFQGVAETSAATALASRMCALIQSEYPDLWPETVRALIVNSAEWTPAMLRHLSERPTKAELRRLLLARYGYGVPNAERALFSKRNALTLVAEGSIQPFVRAQKDAKLNEMKMYSLPWPRAALQALETTEVTMKVTLSYFIEPNPSETARNRNSRYASHGLRFAVNLPDENSSQFQKRVNKLSREEGETIPRHTDDGWLLGTQLRSKGSLHHDIWRGPASDLARRERVAVFPVSGWWKDRPQLEKVEKIARFALVISIGTPAVETDIYTPVANVIAIEV